MVWKNTVCWRVMGDGPGRTKKNAEGHCNCFQVHHAASLHTQAHIHALFLLHEINALAADTFPYSPFRGCHHIIINLLQPCSNPVQPCARISQWQLPPRLMTEVSKSTGPYLHQNVSSTFIWQMGWSPTKWQSRVKPRVIAGNLLQSIINTCSQFWWTFSCISAD